MADEAPIGPGGSAAANAPIRLEQGQIKVDAGQLPRPRTTMFANAAGARVRGQSVEIVFAQLLPGKKQACTVAAISMPCGGIRESLSRSAELIPLVSEYLKQRGGDRAPLLDLDSAYEPSDAHCVMDRATMLMMGFHEDTAEMEFYRLSPLDLHAITTTLHQVSESRPLVHPILAVCLPTELYCSLVGELDRATDAEGRPR